MRVGAALNCFSCLRMAKENWICLATGNKSQQPDEQKLTNSHRSLLMCALASYTPGTEIEKKLSHSPMLRTNTQFRKRLGTVRVATAMQNSILPRRQP